jgi:hypothetical protein
MGRSHTYLELDARRRLPLGAMARHDMYLVQVAPTGVITLTPAEVTPLVETGKATPPVRKKRASAKKAAAAETPQEREQQDASRAEQV